VAPRTERTTTAAPRNQPASATAPLLREIARFDDWFLALRRGENPAAASGLQLAQQRRTALKELISLDPRAALAHAVPRGLRGELPAEIAAELETPIDDYGRLDVIAVCFGVADVTLREATIAGRRYEVFVYGRRLAAPSKHRLPMHGIALDDRLALDEHPYRRLEADGASVSPGEPTAGVQVAVGDEVQVFVSPAALDEWSERVAAAEAAPGPDSSMPDTAAAITTTWVLGEKTVLWLRAEFPDDPGSPATDQQLTDAMAAVNSYYAEVSRDRTSFKATVFPGTLRTAATKATVAASPSTGQRLISDDVLQQARDYDSAHGATGEFNPDRYDRWIVIFKKVPELGQVQNGVTVNWAGLASVGNKSLWLNGSMSAGTIAHELGHNQGLRHSHAWKPSTSSPIQPGELVEYGDQFDVMGNSSSIPAGHFNTKQKTNLLYLAATETTAVTASAVQRIYRADHRAASGVQALKIAAGSAYEYWLELRQQSPTYLAASAASRLRSGVLLHWGSRPSFATGEGTFLLDATPLSSTGMNDAALALGETYTDPDYGINITPVATGGTSPAEWIDVRVDFGATGSNRNPVIAAAPPADSLLVARTDITFTASGSDPDGDQIYYRWDFGDGQIAPTNATVQHRWLKGGTYTVNVTGIDGKGGIATKSFSVSVADPLFTWSRRASGLTGSTLYSVVYGGGKFVAAGDSGTVVTSPDGIVWSLAATLPARFIGRRLTCHGSRFVAAGSAYIANTWTGGVFWSGDGLTWQAGTLPAGAAELNAVTAGAGRVVAVGKNGKLYISPEGAVWTEASSPVTSELYGIGFADGQFVAVGQSGRVLVSPDGVTWTNRSVASSATLVGVARTGGTWYVTSGLEVWTSVDAATWSKAPASPGGTGYSLFSTSSGLLLAGVSGGKIALAENSRIWESVTVNSADTSAAYYGLADGNGVIVAVGSRGALYTAGTPVLSVSAPTIIAQPENQSVVAGQGVTLAVAANSSVALAYQWKRNGAIISGATSATYVIASVQSVHAGSYTVTVSNVVGSVTSGAAALTVNPSARLSNLSVRTTLASAQTLIVGFAVSGGSKPILLRAAGPALVPLGQTGCMGDPKLVLYQGAAAVTENNDWPAALGATFATVGAFPFPANSRDAALLQNLSGSYSVHVNGTGPGLVLLEGYDTGAGSAVRLVNLSARNRVGTGDDILINGFYVAGTGTIRLLIRAVGPTLGSAPFNVAGTLADPKLEIYNAAGARITVSDNWDPALAATFASVAAFALVPGSKDAALVVVLAAGNSYTAQTMGADGGTGEAMVEIYELP
jgi:hypothetical protein